MSVLTDEEIEYWIGSNSTKKAVARAIEQAMLDKLKNQESLNEINHVDTRRIVACVNACELISTDELENTLATGGLVNLKFNFYQVKEQRDTLIEAIKAALEESPVSRKILQAALKEVKA